MKSIGNCFRGFGMTLLVLGIVAMAGFTLADDPGDPGSGGSTVDCSASLCETVCEGSPKPDRCTDQHGQCSQCACMGSIGDRWCEVG